MKKFLTIIGIIELLLGVFCLFSGIIVGTIIFLIGGAATLSVAKNK